MKDVPVQQVVKARRDYNTWVANETLEDGALRLGVAFVLAPPLAIVT